MLGPISVLAVPPSPTCLPELPSSTSNILDNPAHDERAIARTTALLEDEEPGGHDEFGGSPTPRTGQKASSPFVKAALPSHLVPWRSGQRRTPARRRPHFTTSSVDRTHLHLSAGCLDSLEHGAAVTMLAASDSESRRLAPPTTSRVRYMHRQAYPWFIIHSIADLACPEQRLWGSGVVNCSPSPRSQRQEGGTRTRPSTGHVCCPWMRNLAFDATCELFSLQSRRSRDQMTARDPPPTVSALSGAHPSHSVLAPLLSSTPALEESPIHRSGEDSAVNFEYDDSHPRLFKLIGINIRRVLGRRSHLQVSDEDAKSPASHVRPQPPVVSDICADRQRARQCLPGGPRPHSVPSV
ncbi:hypothetical protein GSI_01365 [Ganoderma sinense ZZ0214-1]|uniref:Uncharacterized protein n=1 Tax=Ganoderma sinense ZZ0214-1 TaxID=1077348 RepID=A0A2G8SV81_9APHY|nr:hypothetical protein GSI_01365 [Ganoderma sinense ZZ0214-1]